MFFLPQAVRVGHVSDFLLQEVSKDVVKGPRIHLLIAAMILKAAKGPENSACIPVTSFAS